VISGGRSLIQLELDDLELFEGKTLQRVFDTVPADRVGDDQQRHQIGTTTAIGGDPQALQLPASTAVVVSNRTELVEAAETLSAGEAGAKDDRFFAKIW